MWILKERAFELGHMNTLMKSAFLQEFHKARSVAKIFLIYAIFNECNQDTKSCVWGIMTIFSEIDVENLIPYLLFYFLTNFTIHQYK